MGKQHEAKKDPKKKPAMTLKEKRAAKKAKKMEKSPHRVVPEQ
ncbi:MAG TPA: hypothetical protein VLS27_12635 [Gammaproteobacteria bacterium]|nr:hypothetical protein [Gammaproteobacteria bacterium]